MAVKIDYLEIYICRRRSALEADNEGPEPRPPANFADMLLTTGERSLDAPCYPAMLADCYVNMERATACTCLMQKSIQRECAHMPQVQ